MSLVYLPDSDYIGKQRVAIWKQQLCPPSFSPPPPPRVFVQLARDYLGISEAEVTGWVRGSERHWTTERPTNILLRNRLERKWNPCEPAPPPPARQAQHKPSTKLSAIARIGGSSGSGRRRGGGALAAAAAAAAEAEAEAEAAMASASASGSVSVSMSMSMSMSVPPTGSDPSAVGQCGIGSGPSSDILKDMMEATAAAARAPDDAAMDSSFASAPPLATPSSAVAMDFDDQAGGAEAGRAAAGESVESCESRAGGEHFGGALSKCGAAVGSNAEGGGGNVGATSGMEVDGEEEPDEMDEDEEDDDKVG